MGSAENKNMAHCRLSLGDGQGGEILQCGNGYAVIRAFLVPLRETQSAARSNVACMRCPRYCRRCFEWYSKTKKATFFVDDS